MRKPRRLPISRRIGSAMRCFEPAGAQEDVQRRRAQAAALAIGAGGAAHVVPHALLHEVAVAVLVAAVEVRNHALEREAELALVGLGRAVDENALRAAVELLEGRGLVDLHPVAEAPDHAPVVDVHAAPVLAPRLDRALAQGDRGVGHAQTLVELADRAEAVAPRARAVGRVEREEPRLQLLQAALGMVGAGEALAEAVLDPGAVVFDQGEQDALGQTQRDLDGVDHASARVRADDDAVDDGVDRVQLVAAQTERVVAAGLERVADVEDRAVHAGAHEALPLEALDRFAVVALLPADDRRRDHDPRALRQGHQRLGDLRSAAGGDRLAAARRPARRLAASRKQQAQVVVDLGRGRDGGARVVPAGSLLDRDGGGEALDRLDVGLLKLVEELPRVGAQRLHVLALALGKDGVEREGALAGARDPRDDDELIARDVDVDAAEVVLARAAYAYGVRLAHRGGAPCVRFALYARGTRRRRLLREAGTR
jgi:hypothetical protein